MTIKLPSVILIIENKRGEIEMRKYCLWVELEFEDGGRLRSNLKFDSYQEREQYIENHKGMISDLEYSEDIEAEEEEEILW